jgi:hypothetical protein
LCWDYWGVSGLRKRNPEKKKVVKIPPAPSVPGSFPLTKPGNLATLASLALEFFQVRLAPLVLVLLAVVYL